MYYYSPTTTTTSFNSRTCEEKEKILGVSIRRVHSWGGMSTIPPLRIVGLFLASSNFFFLSFSTYSSSFFLSSTSTTSYFYSSYFFLFCSASTTIFVSHLQPVSSIFHLVFPSLPFYPLSSFLRKFSARLHPSSSSHSI
jgi:hypothetical protein